ncbi:TPA: hypothetical protein ACNH8R_002305 [Pseudomonas aeruginosa]
MNRSHIKSMMPFVLICSVKPVQVFIRTPRPSSAKSSHLESLVECPLQADPSHSRADAE